MPYFSRCLALVIALGGAACVDTSRVDAALATIEQSHIQAQRHDAQIAWLRMQLAVFATELQARSAADRDLLLQRLSTLQAENAALAQRLDRLQARPEALAAGAPLPERPAASPGAPPARAGGAPPYVLAPLPPTPPALLQPVIAPAPAPTPLPLPPPPPRRVEARMDHVRGIDEVSPY
jgi:hypothetical protein